MDQIKNIAIIAHVDHVVKRNCWNEYVLILEHPAVSLV